MTLARLYHPDKEGGSTAKQAQLNEAYEILGGYGTRTLYHLNAGLLSLNTDEEDDPFASDEEGDKENAGQKQAPKKAAKKGTPKPKTAAASQSAASKSSKSSKTPRQEKKDPQNKNKEKRREPASDSDEGGDSFGAHGQGPVTFDFSQDRLHRVHTVRLYACACLCAYIIMANSISAWAKQRQHRPMCCVNEYAIFLHVMMMLPRPANCSSVKKSLMRSVSAESPSSNGTRAPS